MYMYMYMYIACYRGKMSCMSRHLLNCCFETTLLMVYILLTVLSSGTWGGNESTWGVDSVPWGWSDKSTWGGGGCVMWGGGVWNVQMRLSGLTIFTTVMSWKKSSNNNLMWICKKQNSRNFFQRERTKVTVFGECNKI